MDLSFKGYIKRIFWVLLGQAISAYGIGMTIFADLGLAPWDVFNQGVALQIYKHFGVEVMMGTITMASATAVIIIDVILKEKIGVALYYCKILQF